MKDKTRPSTANQTEQPFPGIVVIQNIPNIKPQYSKIAREHGFKVANKSETVKTVTPFGDKNSNVLYNIPCGCHKYS